jgi:hypothetical protein
VRTKHIQADRKVAKSVKIVIVDVLKLVHSILNTSTHILYRGPFPGAKARPGRDADHSPSYSAEVKNE